MQILEELRKLTFDEFSQDAVRISAAERQLQVAIQAAIDIGEHILAEINPGSPADYADVFLKLATVGVIPAKFGRKLAAMARFGKMLVHLYLEVDVGRVYEYLQHNLSDVARYARYVTTFLEHHHQVGQT